MNTTILTVIILMGLLLVSGALYFAVLSSTAQERIKYQRQAKLDFRNARGGVHLKLMREATDWHLQAQRRCRSTLDEAKKRQADAQARHDRELRQALEAQILQTRLREIPGIGPTLAAQLQWYAQKNKGLSSLRFASIHVSGVGDARQAAIDAWVTSREAQMPILLAGDFLGKADIQKKATMELADITTEIEKLIVEQTVLAGKLDRLRAEIEPLEQVTPHAFYRVLQDPQSMSDDVELYLRGVFAEWDPVPDWFREIVEGVSS